MSEFQYMSKQQDFSTFGTEGTSVLCNRWKLKEAVSVQEMVVCAVFVHFCVACCCFVWFANSLGLKYV